MAEITWLDALVGIVIVASAVYAAWKGLLRETTSIFGWALAAYAALVFGPMLRTPLHELFSPKWLGDVIAYAGVFLIVLVPLSFLSFRFSESIQKSPVGPVDRTLGFVFGIGRGLVLVALPYIAFTMLVPIKEQPGWIKSAATLPLIQKTSDVLLSLVPNQSRHGEAAVAERPRKTRAQAWPNAKERGPGNPPENLWRTRASPARQAHPNDG